MISKGMIKLVHSLEQKKIRHQERLFVAEGPKVVGDLLKVASPRLIIATDDWMRQQGDNLPSDGTTTAIATDDELRKASFLQHPQQVIGVFPMTDDHTPDAFPTSQLCLALDGVQDPGNLGTIIRIADWFGIEHIYCSETTTDLYNPKVVQATMGSIARVKLHYTNLPTLISQLPEGFPVYGTLLDGHDLYSQPLTPHGLIVMGNEGNGISAEVARLVNHRLLIPNYPAGRKTADSLNVAIATAITCAEFRRRTL
ncbi:MAG: RNA methyltransferase [Prevotella sp.]|nr:RNA methyltransferase [Prevotella sp.]